MFALSRTWAREASVLVRLMSSKRPAADRRHHTSKRRNEGGKEAEPGLLDLGEGASVEFLPQLLAADEAEGLMHRLQLAPWWEQREVRILGRPILQPRLVAYMADHPSLRYTYSGATLEPLPWEAPVQQIKDAVERYTGCTFNSCLLNLYRSGDDHLGWHSDNEPLYGPQPTIASVSLGTFRDFLLRRNSDPGDKWRWRLGQGSLLVMRGTTQQHWRHSVPKRRGREGARINLTFRRVLEPEGGKRGKG